MIGSGLLPCDVLGVTCRGILVVLTVNRAFSNTPGGVEGPINETPCHVVPCLMDNTHCKIHSHLVNSIGESPESLVGVAVSVIGHEHCCEPGPDCLDVST